MDFFEENNQPMRTNTTFTCVIKGIPTDTNIDELKQYLKAKNKFKPNKNTRG